MSSLNVVSNVTLKPLFPGLMALGSSCVDLRRAPLGPPQGPSTWTYALWAGGENVEEVGNGPSRGVLGLPEAGLLPICSRRFGTWRLPSICRRSRHRVYVVVNKHHFFGVEMADSGFKFQNHHIYLLWNFQTESICCFRCQSTTTRAQEWFNEMQFIKSNYYLSSTINFAFLHILLKK